MLNQLNPTTATQPGHDSDLESRYRAAEEIADKYGYYYSVLSDEDKVQYRLAAKQEGLEEEIKLLKMRVHNMQVLCPFDYVLLAKFVALIERLQKTHARLFNKEREVADSDKKMDKISDRLSSTLGAPMNRAMRRALARG